jgi:predicted transcriptional regulator
VKEREQFNRDALAAWTHYQTTGLHITGEGADAWMQKFEAARMPILLSATSRELII